jgi:hypothetical protein
MNHNIINLGIPDASELRGFGICTPGEFQPKAPNPKPHSFMADINTTFMQNIFDLAKAERT